MPFMPFGRCRRKSLRTCFACPFCPPSSCTYFLKSLKSLKACFDPSQRAPLRGTVAGGAQKLRGLVLGEDSALLRLPPSFFGETAHISPPFTSTSTGVAELCGWAFQAHFLARQASRMDSPNASASRAKCRLCQKLCRGATRWRSPLPRHRQQLHSSQTRSAPRARWIRRRLRPPAWRKWGCGDNVTVCGMKVQVVCLEPFSANLPRTCWYDENLGLGAQAHSERSA